MKTTSVRVHTRKIDRGVAQHNMKKAGMVSINKKNGSGQSYFSLNWREAAQY